ncbi:BamA/TamA family outer membrane protein [Sphingobacterium sp. SRCM116780]|uniref:translocation and assembly module lipoprotein TamL n=1 Tax=Sphingobacterium sp. SRCM116780 TaxID=2907623 RepID=UPI001F18DC98|nr:BamA/TamA family outer membrane protein [Sphingobacterium sp. SRCM116780]UIR54701.1 BamA/TamA family outer membrane protein [Sphingobacterium sp. SRCM116780]
MKKNNQFIILVLFLGLFIASCSTTKNLKEGESLYVDGHIDIESDTISKEHKKALSTHLEEVLMPKPNKSILGWRYKLAFNNMAGNDSIQKGFIRKQLKKWGEEPVLLSDVNREYNENLIRNRLENMGFFNAEVKSDTTIEKKEATIHYIATPNLIYKIKSVKFDLDSSIQLGKDILKFQDKSLLKVGKHYSFDDIINERDRIDNELKNIGYYYFSPDYILVQVDSTVGSNKVDMYVTIKPETPAIAKSPSKINNIYIFPNYTGSGSGYQRTPRNAVLYDSTYYFIDPRNTFRKPVIANHIFFKKGDMYNRGSHNKTISHLVNLNSFKFVKNNFVDSKDVKNALDVYYYLTPLPKKSIRVELLGKMASVYNGSEINVNWQLRNAFKGAETLSLNVFGGYETQTGGSVSLNSSYYRYGADLTLSFPRILSPFKISPSRRFIPKTYIKTGFEFLNRMKAYTLRSINLDYGYVWQESEEKQHDLGLIEITYVQPSRISPEYQAQMDTVPTLKHAIEPQFTIGPNYNFTLSNTLNKNLKNTFYFKGNLDLSGNVLGLIKGANYKEGKTFKLLNAYFSQYIKVSGDGRHYMKLSENSQLASRVSLGLSYSYGNSNALPYLKQYYVGGPNSIRAFAARAIGPGTLKPQNIGSDKFYADQTGDIKLELNTEYRAKLAGFVHWAAFIDAGNVWLQNTDDEKPGAKFSKDFLTELAVGGGLGLRFDFSFLILRTDFAIPFRIPYLEKGDRWVFKDIDLGSKAWRKNNLMFNLAIGYPF